MNMHELLSHRLCSLTYMCPALMPRVMLKALSREAGPAPAGDLCGMAGLRLEETAVFYKLLHSTFLYPLCSAVLLPPLV